MSSAPETVQTFIEQTLSCEHSAIVKTEKAAAARYAKYVEKLHNDLEKALSKNNQKKAIYILDKLIAEDEEDETLQELYQFLLLRVGVNRKEPWFSISAQPFVRTLSTLFMLVPIVFFLAQLLEPSHTNPQTDVLICLLAAISFFCIPLIDNGIASAFNYVNRYRLRD